MAYLTSLTSFANHLLPHVSLPTGISLASKGSLIGLFLSCAFFLKNGVSHYAIRARANSLLSCTDTQKFRSLLDTVMSSFFPIRTEEKKNADLKEIEGAILRRNRFLELESLSLLKDYLCSYAHYTKEDAQQTVYTRLLEGFNIYKGSNFIKEALLSCIEHVPKENRKKVFEDVMQNLNVTYLGSNKYSVFAYFKKFTNAPNETEQLLEYFFRPDKNTKEEALRILKDCVFLKGIDVDEKTTQNIEEFLKKGLLLLKQLVNHFYTEEGVERMEIDFLFSFLDATVKKPSAEAIEERFQPLLESNHSTRYADWGGIIELMQYDFLQLLTEKQLETMVDSLFKKFGDNANVQSILQQLPVFQQHPSFLLQKGREETFLTLLKCILKLRPPRDDEDAAANPHLFRYNALDMNLKVFTIWERIYSERKNARFFTQITKGYLSLNPEEEKVKKGLTHLFLLHAPSLSIPGFLILLFAAMYRFVAFLKK